MRRGNPACAPVKAASTVLARDGRRDRIRRDACLARLRCGGRPYSRVGRHGFGLARRDEFARHLESHGLVRGEPRSRGGRAGGNSGPGVGSAVRGAKAPAGRTMVAGRRDRHGRTGPCARNGKTSRRGVPPTGRGPLRPAAPQRRLAGSRADPRGRRPGTNSGAVAARAARRAKKTRPRHGRLRACLKSFREIS